jgi:hypothetical protein
MDQWGMDGMLLRSIFVNKICMNIIEKTIATGLVLFVRGIPVTEDDGCSVHPLE